MTFLADLRHELGSRGIRGRLADRIEAELADHLACDPGAHLGAPAEIAERFAAELRVVRTRRASLETFGALALTGSLFVATAALVGNYSTRTTHSPVAGLALVVLGQIAFVAGMLALVRGLRGRTAGDFRLAQRRAAVALVSGGVVAVALAVQGATLRPMPLWWHALAIAGGIAAVPALGAAGVATWRAAEITPAGAAAGLSGDLPPLLADHARAILVALGAVAVAGVVFQGVAFEGSAWEGVLRGALEAGGLAAAVAVLGRVLGLRA
jgi:hypothetical protein